MSIIQKIIFYVLSTIMALSPGASFTEGVTGQPDSFLVHQATKQNDKTISKLIYRGLFKYDIYGKLVPDLASSWATSEDGIVYTVTLKENQLWSDGTQITADDLIYTAFKTPDLQGVATDKVNDLTVRYILPNKFSPFISMLTTGVMKANSEENYNKLMPVSSGPFVVASVKNSGPIVKEVVLVSRNKKENIKKIIFRYYSTESELMTAAKLGEIDGFMARETHELENFENYRFPLQGVYFALFFNMNNESVLDVNLRQKLARSLPIEKIIFNDGIAVQGAISRSPFTDVDLDFNEYDKDLRDDLEDVTLTITVPDIKKHRDMAKIVKNYWEDALGVDVKIKTVASQSFVDAVVKPRDYEILLFGQEINRDPDRYVNWHSTQKDNPGLNLAQFEHVKVDRALEEGREELDNEVRKVHYNEFQKIILEQVPAIFLYHPYQNFYVNKRFSGIGEKYTFTQADRFLDFSNWKRPFIL